MRKWYVPLTVLGLSGIGLLLLSEPGRRKFRWLMQNIQRAPEALVTWNETAQRELDRIQTALNRVAATLEGVR
jgi:hypothetical protein